MGLAQIIILFIFALIFMITSFRLLTSCIDNMNTIKSSSASMSIVGLIMIFMIILALTVSLCIDVNNKNEQLKGKCPELIKLDNVYKIK